MATAWDEIATSFTQTRERLGTLDRRPAVVHPAPPRRVQPPPPRPVAPPVPPPVVEQRKKVTEDEIKALIELQARGAQFGVDTTQLDPEPDQSVADFTGKLSKVFDAVDRTVLEMARLSAEARIADPQEQQPTFAGGEPLPSLFDQTLGRAAGAVGRGALGLARTEIGQAVPESLIQIFGPLGRFGLASVLNAVQSPEEPIKGKFFDKFNEAQTRLESEATNPLDRILASSRALNEPGVRESAPQIPVRASDLNPLARPSLNINKGALTADEEDPIFYVGLADLGEALFDVSNLLPVIGGTRLATVPLRVGAEVVEAGIRRAPGLLDEAGEIAARVGARAERAGLPSPVSTARAAFDEARPKEILEAVTGQRFEGTSFRGFGRETAEEAFDPRVGAQENIFGDATYSTPIRSFADEFGPRVEEIRVVLDNPLVISTDAEYGALAREAGLRAAAPANSEEVAALRKVIQDRGHDGVIIRVPESEIVGKRIQQVFGEDTVVDFKGIRPDVEQARVALDDPAARIGSQPVSVAELERRTLDDPAARLGGIPETRPVARQADEIIAPGAQRIDPDELPQTGQVTFDEAGEVRVTDVGPREDDIIGDDSLRVQGQFFGEEDLKVYDEANPVEDLPLFEQVYDDTPLGVARRDLDSIEEQIDIVQGRVPAEGELGGRLIDRENSAFSTVGISDNVLAEFVRGQGANPYEPGVLMRFDLEADDIGALRQRTLRGGPSKKQDRITLRNLQEDLIRGRQTLEDAEDAAFKSEEVFDFDWDTGRVTVVETGRVLPPEEAAAVIAREIEKGPPLDVRGTGVQQETFGEITKIQPTERVNPTVKTVARAREELKGEWIDSALPDSPEDMAASGQLETGSAHTFIAGIPAKNTPPSKAFSEGMQSLRNVSPALARSLDPARLFDTIQNGRHGGLISKNIGWPTRRMHQNSINFNTKLKVEIQDLVSKYDLNKSEYREAAGDVIEYIGTADVGVDEVTLLAKTEIKNFVKQYPIDVQRRIVGFAQDIRSFYDDGVNTQNLARAKRGDAPINILENYRPWIMAQKSWRERLSTIGFRKNEAGVVDGLSKEATDRIFGDRTYPTFMAPQHVFNPRAMERTYGLKDVAKERDLVKLTVGYIDSMSDDIYNNTIINNVFRHTKPMREANLVQAADALDTWVREGFAGVPTPQGRAIRDLVPKPLVEGALFIRRQLTRAVFPLNWQWNLIVQPSSVANTILRYGVRNNVRALDAFVRPSVKSRVERAYSGIIKKQRAGKVAYQDIGEGIERSGRLGRSKMEKAEDVANYLTGAIEEKLTRHGIRAAELRGEQLGFKGRELLEFASDGGARTQSMYDKPNVVGILRSREIGAIAPFQTFAFEILNTVRELNIPGLRRAIGQAGAYNTLTANSALGAATTTRRIKQLLEWVAAMYAINVVSDKAMNRKPWNLGSFIPFYSLISAGAQGYGPMNAPLFVKFAGDFWDAAGDFLETGRWHGLRNFATRYFVLGGSQVTKTLIGIEAVAEGGVRDRRGALKFEINPEEWLTAYSQGVYATQGGKEYIEEKFDRTALEEFTGLPIPDVFSIEARLTRKHRNEYQNYLDIPGDDRKARERSRRQNPDLDAYMFITGKVTTLKSIAARDAARKIVAEENLLAGADEEKINLYGKRLGYGWVSRQLAGAEDTGPEFERREEAPQAVPTPEGGVPFERRSSADVAEENWNRVSALLDLGDLTALSKVWDGKVISRKESASLRKVFKEEPLGQSNFRTWMKQTLRQVQENAAVASRMRESREFATV